MTALSTGLAYGRGELHLNLPAGARPTVIRKRPMQKLADPTFDGVFRLDHK